MPGGVDADDCTSFGLYTILFDLGGVEVDFGASSFCFHTFLSFLGGVGTTFGVSSLAPVSFYFLCFSCLGCLPVEVVFQPPLCLVGSVHT